MVYTENCIYVHTTNCIYRHTTVVNGHATYSRKPQCVSLTDNYSRKEIRPDVSVKAVRKIIEKITKDNYIAISLSK